MRRNYDLFQIKILEHPFKQFFIDFFQIFSLFNYKIQQSTSYKQTSETLKLTHTSFSWYLRSFLGGFQTTFNNEDISERELETQIIQNLQTDNFEAALNNIIKLMNISEKERLKRVEILRALEKKVLRRLQVGKNEEAIEELKDIIDEYRRLKLFHRAEILELALNEFINEFQQEEDMNATTSFIELPGDQQAIIQYLEACSKKAIRRIFQGQVEVGLNLLSEIIEEFRNLGNNAYANALEDWTHQFQKKAAEPSPDEIPLSERLQIDPELAEQLLSYRTQKIMKYFIKGMHRRAVLEFTEIVNEYKRKGELEIVEMLEVWFNLFVTKMFMKPSPPPPSSPPPAIIGSSPTSQKMPHSKETPPTPEPKPSSASLPLSQIPIPQSLIPKTPSKYQVDSPTPAPQDKFKEKISRIKTLLEKFEKSLEPS
ncbi:MAG: hypothetical protein ACTSRS_09290 [Candidatus Helarchaeota archaeon]